MQAKKPMPVALPTVERILFPTDFSEGCYRALPWVQKMAQLEGAEIHLLHVVQDIPVVAEMGLYFQGGVFQPEVFLEAAEARLEIEQWRFESHWKPVKLEVRLGDPASEIDAYARELGADLVIMTSHQPGFFERVFRGSVAAGAIQEAPCPILVVPDLPDAA